MESLSRDARARQQRIALRTGRAERIDEPGAHGVDQSLLGDSAAYEEVFLPVFAVDPRDIVVPSCDQAFGARDHVLRVGLQSVPDRPQWLRPIEKVEIPSDPVRCSEFGRIERTAGWID